MVELVYVVLMYGLKVAVPLGLTEMLDNYNDSEVLLEVNPRDYYNLTGYSQFITADKRKRILNQTFIESSLRNINSSCIRSWTIASKGSLTKTFL